VIEKITGLRELTMTVRQSLTVAGLLLTANAGSAGPGPANVFLAPAVAAELAPPVPPERVRAAVAGLAANDYQDRERAHADLLALGEKASGQLRRTLPTVTDAETRRRLGTILQKLDAERLTTARRVTLVTGRVTAPEAFRRVARQAGYRLRAEGLGDDFEKRRVHDFALTNVPFWEAVDAIGNASGLGVQVEEDGLLRVFNQDAYNPHVSYSGPFRFVANQVTANRFLTLGGLSRQSLPTANPEQLGLNLTVFAEPKATIVGTRGPWVVKVLDEAGKPVAQVPQDTSTSFSGGGYKGFAHNLHVSFQRPARESLTFKELRAKAGIVVLTETKPDAIVPDLAKAKGTRVVGRTATIDVTDVVAAPGHLSVTMNVTNPTGNPNDYQWVNALWQRFEATDGTAAPYGVNVTNTNYVNGQQVTCTFQVTPPDGAKLGRAVSFTLVEWVTRSIDVEFSFKDVPLP
jgi:hypothetical protein